MIKRIIYGLAMPLLFAVLLLLWEYFTIKDYKYFLGIIVFFILGFILNLFLKKIVGYSFHVFLILYFITALLICLLITPSPYKTWITFQALSKKTEPVNVSGCSSFPSYDYVIFKDAVTLRQTMGIEAGPASEGGGSNGARGIMPVVDKDYKSGDSIYAYAAFTSHYSDTGNVSWFFLDKDEDDYAEAWKEKIVSAKIVKDTSRIKTYSMLMERANAQYKLLPASKITFLEANFPSAEIRYVANKLTVTGIVMLILAAAININGAVRKK